MALTDRIRLIDDRTLTIGETMEIRFTFDISVDAKRENAVGVEKYQANGHIRDDWRYTRSEGQWCATFIPDRETEVTGNRIRYKVTTAFTDSNGRRYEAKEVLSDTFDIDTKRPTLVGTHTIDNPNLTSANQVTTITFAFHLLLGSLDRIVLGSDLSRVDDTGATIGAGLARGLAVSYDSQIDMLAINPAGGQNAMSAHVRGVMESGIKDYDDRVLKMPLKTAQTLLETKEVSKIIVLLNETDRTAQAQARIERVIEERGLQLETRPWSSLAVFYDQVVNLFNGIFFFIKTIVSTIVVFMISNTMMMNVLERTREIGTLRAIGLTEREVSRLFLLEGVIMGFVGAVLSIAVGIALAELININGVPMPPSPGYSRGYLAFIRWTDDWSLFWFSSVLAIVTAFAASILPARRASKLVIAQAFRHS
ncbi:ABC transporter permease [Verminephrobacter sp. Larva24]|nr:ABC transporter permease [Verminephrobacter sp. Larva24]